MFQVIELDAEKIKGQKFGRLLVVDIIPNPKRKYGPLAVCLCECGQQVTTRRSKILGGDVRSCGCLKREKTAAGMGRKHGKYGTKVYAAWQSMRNRCYRPTDASYARYGGRGITVCERWIHSFENFYADMGDAPQGGTLDRKDGNGNYEPGNCRWATAKEQSQNRSATKFFTVNGETLCISDWARKLGVSDTTMSSRFKKYPPEVAVSKPFRRRS